MIFSPSSPKLLLSLASSSYFIISYSKKNTKKRRPTEVSSSFALSSEIRFPVRFIFITNDRTPGKRGRRRRRRRSASSSSSSSSSASSSSSTTKNLYPYHGVPPAQKYNGVYSYFFISKYLKSRIRSNFICEFNCTQTVSIINPLIFLLIFLFLDASHKKKLVDNVGKGVYFLFLLRRHNPSIQWRASGALMSKCFHLIGQLFSELFLVYKYIIFYFGMYSFLWNK